MATIILKNENEKLYPIPALPIGYIYQSLSSTSPASIFGGTWTKMEAGFFMGCDSSFSDLIVKSGSNVITLTTSQIPSHYHGFTNYNSTSSNAWKGVMENAAAYTSKIDTTLASVGGGGEHENKPPLLGVHTWRKTGN